MHVYGRSYVTASSHRSLKIPPQTSCQSPIARGSDVGLIPTCMALKKFAPYTS